MYRRFKVMANRGDSFVNRGSERRYPLDHGYVGLYVQADIVALMQCFSTGVPLASFECATKYFPVRLIFKTYLKAEYPLTLTERCPQI